tara:strand:+ start:767 stop:1060 length:294 start_codon:yes stop_codon:yes gene_type:complete
MPAGKGYKGNKIGRFATFKELSSQDKVMTMNQGIADVRGGIKKAVGRGGGLHGLSGDKHVYGRYTGEEDTNPEKKPKLSPKYQKRMSQRKGTSMLTK